MSKDLDIGLSEVKPFLSSYFTISGVRHALWSPHEAVYSGGNDSLSFVGSPHEAVYSGGNDSLSFCLEPARGGYSGGSDSLSFV